MNTTLAPKTIKLSWDAFTLDADTGRDPITYYKLEYNDNVSSGWTELTSSSNSPVTIYNHTLSTPFPAN